MLKAVAIVIALQITIGAIYLAKKSSGDLNQMSKKEAYLFCMQQSGGSEQTCKELAFGEKSNNRRP